MDSYSVHTQNIVLHQTRWMEILQRVEEQRPLLLMSSQSNEEGGGNFESTERKTCPLELARLLPTAFTPQLRTDHVHSQSSAPGAPGTGLRLALRHSQVQNFKHSLSGFSNLDICDVKGWHQHHTHRREHKQMASNGFEMRVYTRNTYARTVTGPTVERGEK